MKTSCQITGFYLDVSPVLETIVQKSSLKPIHHPQEIDQCCKFYSSKTEFDVAIPTNSD